MVFWLGLSISSFKVNDLRKLGKNQLLEIVRLLTVISGLVLALASSLLYETEDHIIQNKLDLLWIKLSDAESLAMSRQARLLRVVAGMTNRFFDNIFGPALLSVRSAGVSASLSMASLGIVCSPGIYELGFDERFQTLHMPVVLMFLLLAIAPLLLRNKLPKFLWAGTVLSFCALAFAGMSRVGWFERPFDSPVPFREGTLDFAFLALAIACDTLFIAATRWMIRWSSIFQTPFRILAGAMGSVFLAIILLILPAYLGLGREGFHTIIKEKALIGVIENKAMFNSSPASSFLLSIAGSNVLDALVASVFFCLFALLLAHLIFWPALQRPVYAIATRGVVARRKLFLVFGVLLVGLGAPKGAVAHFLEVLKKLLKTIASD